MILPNVGDRKKDPKGYIPKPMESSNNRFLLHFTLNSLEYDSPQYDDFFIKSQQLLGNIKKDIREKLAIHL